MKNLRINKSLNLDPLLLAKQIARKEQNYVLLHSSLQSPELGQYSYLAFGLKKIIRSDSWAEFENVLTTHLDPMENAWFGYLGYGLKNSLETLPADAPSFITAPHLIMAQFSTIVAFNHDQNQCVVYSDNPLILEELDREVKSEPSASISCKDLFSNMSKDQYIENVNYILEAIRRGDLFQANLTRKFGGYFTNSVDEWDLFSRLCQISPSPYSCLMKFDSLRIISSSPEQFLKLDSDGTVQARPIKGTAARYADPVKDQASLNFLKTSPKDRCENLMIVDLLRNDLSRSCKPGSIIVKDLFKVTSYATVHHMASTVIGKKRTGVSPITLIQNAFPPGSMTGAPKIQAMCLCSQLEKLQRGIYSGAVGWFKGDGSVDLSVVIRTLILQDDRFELQVGGAIVADSIPEQEWAETLTKATAICQILEVDLTHF